MTASSCLAKRLAILTAIVLSTNCATGLLAEGNTFTTVDGTDGGPAWFDGDTTAARFRNPWRIAGDSSGNFYVADSNQTIRKIVSGGAVSTLAGLAPACRCSGTQPTTA